MDQRGFDNQRSDFLTAREVADRLGVKLATVYSYASRGRLGSVPGVRGRGRLYPRRDVERLEANRDARAGHTAVAAGALRWGQPVLESEITRIANDDLFYRGHSATELARRGLPFESIAELLWADSLPSRAPTWHAPTVRYDSIRRHVRRGSNPIEISLFAVTALALHDPGRHESAPELEWERARRIVRVLPAILADESARARASRDAPTTAAAVAAAFGLTASRPVLGAIDRALVLCADHELNASTFATRVAASAGADLHASLAAGLAALSGPKHGAMTERVEALLDEVGRPEQAKRVVRARASRGSRIPGFGHPLYSGGDPRVAPLFEAARQVGARRPRFRILEAVVSAMRRRGAPNLDVGLVALRSALGMPRGGAMALFAVGRIAGFVAHTIEQRSADFLLRPRAHYVGR